MYGYQLVNKKEKKNRKKRGVSNRAKTNIFWWPTHRTATGTAPKNNRMITVLSIITRANDQADSIVKL